MKHLLEEVEHLLKDAGVDRKSLISAIPATTIYPFSDIVITLSYMISRKIITYDDYLRMTKEYSQRNKYLKLFEMSPRNFGEWGEHHIASIFPQFIKETKNHNPNFDGEYDLILDNIRVEVKACRANKDTTEGSLSDRAFSHSEAKSARFKYHFQQLKPSCCDLFICIGVCKDELIYWILTSGELMDTGKLSSQHRNENTGRDNATVFEGQVFMTEEDLAKFLVREDDLLRAVQAKVQLL